MLAEIDDILTNGVGTNKQKIADINTCATEKAAFDLAAKSESDSDIECTRAGIADTANPNTANHDAWQTACSAHSAAQEANKNAHAAYNACMGAGATALLETMAKKYGDTDKYNANKTASVTSAKELIVKLNEALDGEFASVESAVKADRDQAAADRKTAEDAADKVFNDEKARHEGIVANSKKIMEAADAGKFHSTALV